MNRGATVNSSGGLRSNPFGFSIGKEATISSVKSNHTVSSNTSAGSISRSRDIQCFKCGGCGHIVRECVTSSNLKFDCTMLDLNID